MKRYFSSNCFWCVLNFSAPYMSVLKKHRILDGCFNIKDSLVSVYVFSFSISVRRIYLVELHYMIAKSLSEAKTEYEKIFGFRTTFANDFGVALWVSERICKITLFLVEIQRKKSLGYLNPAGWLRIIFHLFSQVWTWWGENTTRFRLHGSATAKT